MRDYREFNYDECNTFEKWEHMYRMYHVYWYDVESRNYVEIRSLDVLKELWEDEDYCDGIYYRK